MGQIYEAWERDPGGPVGIAVDMLLSHSAAGHTRRVRMLAIEILLQHSKEPLLWFATVAGLGERPLAVEGVSELLDVSGARS